MEKYIGVLSMCIISGVFAALVHMLLTERTKKNFRIKYIFFYAVVFYGAMSVIKALMGEGKETLFSSFHDIEPATYIHYGIPLTVMVIVLPILIKLILMDEKRQLFINLFLSTFSFIIGLEFLIWGIIDTYNYIIICVVTLLTALGFVFFHTKAPEFYEKNTFKDRLTFILPIILLWTVTVLIFEPNQLLLNNLEEFSIPYWDFLGIMSIQGGILIVVYTLIGVFVLSKSQLRAFGTVIFGITVGGYVQGNFLNGEMLLMDGTVQTWTNLQKWINSIIWFAIIVAAIFMNYNVKHKKICKRIVQVVCGYICLMQLLSLVFIIATTKFPDEETEFVLTSDKMLELDEENNVIVFVLDWFDRQIMNDIEEQSPDFTQKLKDFTDYTNTTSCYPFTSLSIPYLLTGIEWEYGMEAAEYCEYAYQNSHLLDDMEHQDYSIGIYTDSVYIGDCAKHKLLNYSDEIIKKLSFKKAFYVMNDTSKYKMAPFAAKQFYFYTTDDIDEIVANDGEYSINNDIIFHNALQKNKLSFDTTKDYSGAFRFYHLKGAHPLFTMNDEFEEVKENGTQLSQSRGALKIVYEYIDEMKKLGIYDNATIIITADHGQNRNVMRKSEISTDYDMTSTPILFVKLPSQHNEEGPVKSMAPVSHTDFMATVMEAAGGEARKYGRTFSQIEVNENRERIFVRVWPPDKRYERYIINGDANNPEFWTKVED